MWLQLLLCYGVFANVCSSLDHQSSDPEQVHLAYGETALDITVTWSTRNPSDSSKVQLKNRNNNWFTAAQGSSIEFAPNEQIKQYIHKVHLHKLKPNTIYEYRCGSPRSWSKSFTFRTKSLDSNWPVSFAIYGDLGLEHATSLPELIRGVKRKDYDAVIQMGDFVYEWMDDEGRKGDKFMQMIEPIAANVPYMVSPGNHDTFKNFTHFKNRFAMPNPEAENFFYSFNLGPVHFISLNTEAYFWQKEYGYNQMVAQYNWLEKDLKEAVKNRKERPWIITYGHRPMYCNTKDQHGCAMPTREIFRTVGHPRISDYRLEKLFFDHGVDLEIWGHEHNYERIYPLYNFTLYKGSEEEPYTNPGAPIHLVTGSAGCVYNGDPFQDVIPNWSAFRSTDFGFTKVVVYNETHLYFEQLSTNDVENTKSIDVNWVIKEKHGRYGK